MFQGNEIVDWLIRTLTIMPGILVAISFHELAHGYVAYLLGDDTAKNSGRLTLDPISHIDPVGFFMLIFIGFGWAKPVPVNYSNLKNRKRDVILVSLAGSAVNFILAIIGAVLFGIALKLGANQIVTGMISALMQFNLVLGIFNLIPIPPLDGSKVLASLLPLKQELKFYEYEKYLRIILIVLLLTGGIRFFLMPPLNWAMKLMIRVAEIVMFI